MKKEYPVLIVRKDDGEEFIHLGNGLYRTKWGITNGSISQTPITAFGKDRFDFFYKESADKEDEIEIEPSLMALKPFIVPAKGFSYDEVLGMIQKLINKYKK